MSAADRRRTPAVLGAAIVVVLLVAAALMVLEGPGERRVTAYFTQVTGLYVGDEVQVLGVPVGRVVSVTPEPDRVRVELAVDADQPVPADAKAALVAPTVVTVRFVALAPAYTGGPQLADGAVIPQSRTATPVEWDEVKEQVERLALALGPDGANAEGSLSRLLDTTAANLSGRGGDLNRTVSALAEAMSTLADGSGDLFATVRNLQVFVDALADSDEQVVLFNERLATVSGFLADDREDLAAALDGLDRAFTDVQAFLAENRGQLAGTVEDLRPVADVLADNRQQLADALQVAPHALANLYGIYEPIDGSIAGAISAANLQAPGVFVCSALLNLGGSPQMCQDALAPLAELATTAPPPAGVSAVERNGRSGQVVSVPGPDDPPYTRRQAPAGSDDGTARSGPTDLADLLTPGGPR